MPDAPPAPEDFPSLLPKRLVAPDRHAGLDAMSSFMAATRAIADDARMQPHLKGAHLTALEGALTTQEGYVPLPKGVSPAVMSPGFTLRRESDERRVPVIYGRRVAQATKNDMAKKAYRDWSDLLAYLRFSAGSAGQYAADVLGIDRALAPHVEALAIAHALLSRMESLASDVARGRLYLPQRWLSDAGLDADHPTFDGAEGARWLKVRDEGVAQVRKLLTQGAPAMRGLRFAADGAAAANPNAGRAAPGTRTAEGYLAGSGDIEGRGHSGADLTRTPANSGAVDRWKLKLALAWVKAGLEARCDALAASPAFPAPASPPPSTFRLAIATVRAVL
ncbi:MAG: squalene/phytoene synthase family protein [Gemmatimonas sp.]